MVDARVLPLGVRLGAFDRSHRRRPGPGRWYLCATSLSSLTLRVSYGSSPALGEDYAPEMAAPERLAAAIVPDRGWGHRRTRDKPPTTALIGSWQGKLEPWELRLCETVLAGRMERFGYELTGAGRPSARHLALRVGGRDPDAAPPLRAVAGSLAPPLGGKPVAALLTPPSEQQPASSYTRTSWRRMRSASAGLALLLRKPDRAHVVDDVRPSGASTGTTSSGGSPPSASARNTSHSRRLRRVRIVWKSVSVSGRTRRRRGT